MNRRSFIPAIVAGILGMPALGRLKAQEPRPLALEWEQYGLLWLVFAGFPRDSHVKVGTLVAQRVWQSDPWMAEVPHIHYDGVLPYNPVNVAAHPTQERDFRYAETHNTHRIPVPWSISNKRQEYLRIKTDGFLYHRPIERNGIMTGDLLIMWPDRRCQWIRPRDDD